MLNLNTGFRFTAKPVYDS